MPVLVQCAPATASFPWSVVISGIVGVVGTIGGVIATNMGAGRRMRQQQNYEDSRRFHKERAELYGKLLGLTQTFRLRSIELRQILQGKKEDATSAWHALTATMRDLSEAAKTAQLLGGPATQDAADAVLSSAGELGKGSEADDAAFKALDTKFRSAEAKFREAARTELMPAENKTA